MTTPRPILFSFRRCPYAMRARLALLASGTVCTLREVKLSAKPQDLLDASPKGTVPVLVLPDGPVIGSGVIDESLDIMRWALTQADPDHWLDGEDAALTENGKAPAALSCASAPVPQAVANKIAAVADRRSGRRVRFGGTGADGCMGRSSLKSGHEFA